MRQAWAPVVPRGPAPVAQSTVQRVRCVRGEQAQKGPTYTCVIPARHAEAEGGGVEGGCEFELWVWRFCGERVESGEVTALRWLYYYCCDGTVSGHESVTRSSVVQPLTVSADDSSIPVRVCSHSNAPMGVACAWGRGVLPISGVSDVSPVSPFAGAARQRDGPHSDNDTLVHNAIRRRTECPSACSVGGLPRVRDPVLLVGRWGCVHCGLDVDRIV